METLLNHSFCPCCKQAQGVEHIEVTPVEDRTKSADRRIAIDHAYLSLIALDRRNSQNDRRTVDSRDVTIDSTPPRNRVCLNCAHVWHTEDSLNKLAQ